MSELILGILCIILFFIIVSFSSFLWDRINDYLLYKLKNRYSEIMDKTFEIIKITLIMIFIGFPLFLIIALGLGKAIKYFFPYF